MRLPHLLPFVCLLAAQSAGAAWADDEVPGPINDELPIDGPIDDGSHMDSCAASPCGDHGSCSNTETSYTCTCEEGYTGANCDIPTYTADWCPTTGTAHPVAHSTTGALRCCLEYSCFGICNSDSVFSFETAVAECSKWWGSRLCTLAELKFEKCCFGSGCAQADLPAWYDNCATGPCGDHGSCRSNEFSYTCTCDKGYSGSNCDIIVGPNN